jgi:virulence-associated protein E
LPYISEAEARQLVDDIVELLCRDFGYVRATARPARKGNGQSTDPAEDWQQLVENILAGNGLHENTRDLAAKMVRSGMDGGAIVNFLRGLMNSSAAPRDQRWQDRYDNLPRQVDSMQAKLENEQAAAAAAAAASAAPTSAPPAPGAGSGVPPPPPSPPPQPTQSQPQPQQRSYMNARSRWACNLGNVILAMQQEPDFANTFGYDEMLCMNILLRPLFKTDPTFKPRPLTDIDVLAVQDWLQWYGFRRLGTETTHRAINKCARGNSYHPVRNYLNGLKWDGRNRLDTWLTRYLGADQNEYTKKIGTMFLISMVARIYQPGCKADYMLVLEYAQGYQKSLVCETLAGEYFDDHMPENIASKEASQHLRGKWLIEWAEMRAYTRAEANATKAFLTRTVERYRPTYGHHEVVEPRQCIFIGTTNKAMYLTDETGNRRIWPVKCGEIDLEALKRDRDQLLAEAVKLYRDDVRWWPDRDLEAKHIEPQQADRFEADVWEEPIDKYLQGKTRTTVIDIAVDVLGYEREPPQPSVAQSSYGQYGQPAPTPIIRGTPINRLTLRDQARISAILTHWDGSRNATTKSDGGNQKARATMKKRHHAEAKRTKN